MLISKSAGVGLLALLIGPLAAQDADPSEEVGPYARVSAPLVELRCFPTDSSPVFGDVMTEGAAVVVGESYGDYRQAVLPLGPVGFVHKKFSSEPENGQVTTVGESVSFRYRPRSGEAPVELLPAQTALHVVGEEGDWWRVRFPRGQAWLALEDLQIFEQPNETLIASYAELGDQTQKAIDEMDLARREALAEAEFLAGLETGLDELRDRFNGEMARPTPEQDFQAIEADLATLGADMPEGSTLLVNAQLLSTQIDNRKKVVEATQVILEEPVPAPDPATLVREVVEDPLARFEAVGWLRYQPSARGMNTFVVEKGGRTLFWLTCTTNRYDLALFDGVEVGLIGRLDRPNRESMRVVDVEKLEVIGLAN